MRKKNSIKSFFMLFLAIGFVGIITSCGEQNATKETEKRIPECEINKTGSVKVTNKKPMSFKVFIDDVQKTTLPPSGGYFIIENVPTGVHQLKYEEASGYLFSPDVYSGTIEVRQCSQYDDVLNMN